MKAGYSKSTHYIAIVLAILAVSALLAFVQNAQAAEAVGRIAKFDGHVDILRGGKLPAVPAKVNDTVFVGDVVRTKTDAKAEIAFSDGNVIKVAQKSRIDISEYAPNSKASLRMPRGKVEAIVEKKIAQRISLSKNANSFEIRTPNAVAGVRGTHFFVINDRNATSVLVKDGTVNVANIRHPEAGVNVGAGHMTTVIGLNPPKQPQPVKEADMKKQEKDTTPTEKKDKKDKAEGGDKGSSEAKSGDQPKDQAKTGDQPQDQGKSKDNSGSKSDSGKSDNTAASGGTTPSGGDSGGSGGSASAGGPGGSTPSFVASATEEAHDTFTSLSQTASTTGTGNLGNLGNAGAGNTGTDKQDPPRRQVTETLQQATTPPKVTISSGPKSQTKANTANFNLTVDDSSATLSYSLDGGPWTQMSGISLTLSNLTEGNHSIEVKGTDTAGNTSTPISYSWTTDYTRATMSSTSDTIQKPVRITDGSYSTISAPGGSYSYSYSDQHKWGSVTYTGSTTGYGVEYTPDGKSIRYDYTYDSTTGTWQKNAGQTAGTWDTSKTLSSQIGSLMGISLPASLDSKHTDDHDDGTFSVAGTIKSPGSLWSTTSSNPATVALSGTVTRNSTSPHRWGAFLTNNSDQSYVFKTDDGGAFIGGALTRESGGALDGKFIGFYVDPSGNAGIMRSDISGSLDATTGAYSLSGATYPEQLPSITGLIPSNFADRLIIKDYYPNDFAKSLSSYNSYGTSTYNAYNDSDFSGPHSFSGNSGAIKGRSSNRITTISIADPNTASATYNMTFPSGVFIEDFKGSFTGALSAWTAKTGNSGAFGSYNLDKNHAGTYNYADGGKYRYHYTTGTNNSGSSVYTVASGRYERPSQQVSYTIYYYSDGTTETITDVYHPDGDSFSSNTVKGTWDTTLSPSALVATPPVKDYPDSANYTSKHSRDGASDLGYWLADVTGGTWAGGKLSGSLTGNFITKTKLGTLSGDILGVYDANDSSWIADALGKYDGTPLKFVSSLSGSMEASQRLYYQHYKYSAVNDFYEYTYNNNEKVGHVTYQRYDLSTPVWYDIEYNSDGTTTRTDHYYDSTKLTFTTTTQTQGTWDTTQPVLSSIATTPPDASYTSSTSGDFPTNAFDGSLNALMGGVTSIWSATQASPAPVRIMGTYDAGGNNRPHFLSGDTDSYNYINSTHTTYDGGAYTAFTAATEINGAMDGRLIGLYLDPSGNVGYLRGTASGTAYPSISMFEMDGTVYPDQMLAGTGVTAADASSLIWRGYGGDSGSPGYGARLEGALGVDYIQSNTPASAALPSPAAVLNTKALIDPTAKQTLPWGVFSARFYADFANSTAATTWKGKAGGTGSFGSYKMYKDYFGNYSYSGGGSYDYYYTDQNSGNVTYERPDLATPVKYITSYYADGTTFTTNYSYSGGTWVYTAGTSGTWDTTKSLASLATPPDSAYKTSSSYSYWNGTDDKGYWIADVGKNSDGTANGTWSGNKTTGTLNGTFLTPLSTGTLTGDVLGVYNDTDKTLLAGGLGTFSGSRLKFASQLSSTDFSILATSSSNPASGFATQGAVGILDAILGSKDSLWTATQSSPAQTLILGAYKPQDSDPHIFKGGIQSDNALDPAANPLATYDGGAFKAAFSGTEVGNSMSALLTGIYVDPSNNAGILLGSFSGQADQGINMMKLDGGIYPVQIDSSTTNTSLTPSSAYSMLSLIQWTGAVPGPFSFNDGTAVYSMGSPGPAFGSEYGIVQAGNLGWGVWQYANYGSYSGMNTNNINNWSWSLDFSEFSAPPATANINRVAGFDFLGSQWSGNQIAGTAAGYMGGFSGTDAPITAISVGETHGTFNPTSFTFQTVSQGPWIETNKFLAMAGTTSGQNILQQLKIPCVQVGTANLTGSGAYLSVNMNNVIFFAPASGQRPALWATGNVTGSYYGNPIGTTVNLAGSGLTANFNVKQWDTTNDKWVATVTGGTGNLGGAANLQGIQFRGAAAGTMSGYVSSGSISGTAAGIAK